MDNGVGLKRKFDPAFEAHVRFYFYLYLSFFLGDEPQKWRREGQSDPSVG